jgi:hypothetical protein
VHRESSPQGEQNIGGAVQRGSNKQREQHTGEQAELVGGGGTTNTVVPKGRMRERQDKAVICEERQCQR